MSTRQEEIGTDVIAIDEFFLDRGDLENNRDEFEAAYDRARTGMTPGMVGNEPEVRLAEMIARMIRKKVYSASGYRNRDAFTSLALLIYDRGSPAGTEIGEVLNFVRAQEICRGPITQVVVVRDSATWTL